MKKQLSTFLFFALLLPLSAQAATSVPFTVNMSEAVNVSGCPATCPRIAVDVGGVTRYATYSAGSGTVTLTFTYDMVAGDVDLDGVTVSSPVDLNGGSVTDLNGNAIADLTFTPPDTSGVLVNAAVPSGYTVAFTDETVTNTNKTNMGFTLTYNKANRTYNYTISSSGGGAPLTGTGTTTGAAQNITGINLTSLPDGKLTLSLTLTDSLGGTGVAATDTLPMAVLDASLVGHWTFDANDISGTTAYDRSGQGNNGTLQGTPTPVSGYIGSGLSFDGMSSGDRVSLGTSATLNPTTFTLSTWVFPRNTANSYGYIYSNARDCCGAYNGIDIRITSRVYGTIWNSTSVGSSSAPILSNNVWYHVIVTYNGSAVMLYVNGKLVAQTNSTLGIGTPAFYGAYIGAMGYGPATYILDGNLDDVRIYDRALTPAEISTLYNSVP